MYNFNNKTDEQLAELSAAIYAEKKRRLKANISSYPMPVASLGNMVEDIKLYRQMYDVDLLTAKHVIEYYWNKHD